MPPNSLEILEPSAQIDFFYRLESIRESMLFEALNRTVKALVIEELDTELNGIVSSNALSRLASAGLRGERFFVTPLILYKQPTLLGYYRLLYGFSQKAFYSQGPFGRFKVLEEKNELPSRVTKDISILCLSLARTGEQLLDGIPRTNTKIVHDLQLLTLGPQLRGGRNNRIGATAADMVLQMVAKVAEGYFGDKSLTQVVVRNPASRSVVATFSADPDIAIEDFSSETPKPLVSVEIKGGQDVSNIHNRLGEAEKSHQNARRRGFYQFWTIVSVSIDETVAKSESPTTTRFFNLQELRDITSSEWKTFQSELARVLGLPSPTE